MLIAWFLLVIIDTQDWPLMLGPYTRSDCQDVLEWLNRHAYAVSGCELLPLPQVDAIYQMIPFIP